GDATPPLRGRSDVELEVTAPVPGQEDLPGIALLAQGEEVLPAGIAPPHGLSGFGPRRGQVLAPVGPELQLAEGIPELREVVEHWISAVPPEPEHVHPEDVLAVGRAQPRLGPPGRVELTGVGPGDVRIAIEFEEAPHDLRRV